MIKVNGLLVAFFAVVTMLVALGVVNANAEAPRQYGDGTKLWGIVDQTEENSASNSKFGKVLGSANTAQPDLTLEVTGDNDDLFSTYTSETQSQTSSFGAALMSGHEAGTQANWLQNFWNNWTFGH